MLSSISASASADRTINPIRRIVDNLNIPKGATTEKPLIPLSIGDPCKFGNLKTPEIFMKAIQDAVVEFGNHGYQPCAGMQKAREAIAKRHSGSSGRDIDFSKVIITSGCSGALEIAIKGVASEGESILIPRPGFSIYETISRSNKIDPEFYPLIPEKQWEADLDALEKLITDKTTAIVVNNPSNPCGSNYSKQHLLDILKVAEKHHLIVITDEIYGNLVFEGETFYPMASLTKSVPIVEVGGIAKEFLVPGFRVGWIIAHDAPSSEPGKTILQDVYGGMLSLSQVLIGANTLVQAALPKILDPVKGSKDEAELKAFHARTLSELEANAKFITTRLEKIKGLRVISPQGAMYVMVGLDKSLGMDDMEFSQKLLDDQLVFVLPGSCFGMKNFFRVVICAPKDMLADAANRIEAFCSSL